MDEIQQIDVIKKMEEVTNIIMYSKKINFFFGAGTSCAFGLPNISKLTENVRGKLNDKELKIYSNIESTLKKINNVKEVNIEMILNYARMIKDVTGGLDELSFSGISGNEVSSFETSICNNIYNDIFEKQEKADLLVLKKFFAWLTLVKCGVLKEIFTTNYDMLIEKSLEENKTPYYDGFIGSFEPFFNPSSIEKTPIHSDSTIDWIRVWKLHGSLNWNLINDENSTKIIRTVSNDPTKEQLLIYPSTEKYSLSRKDPYTAYFDRMKYTMNDGENLLIINGYSFNDEHINEIIFNSLRTNNKLYVIVLCFEDAQVDFMQKLAENFMNLLVLGPTKLISKGSLKNWAFDDSEEDTIYWNNEKKEFILGDFTKFVHYIINTTSDLGEVK